jgi:hypothetical protein
MLTLQVRYARYTAYKLDITFLYYDINNDDKLNTITPFIAMSILFILIFSLIMLPVAGLSSLNIFPPEAKPYGLTYADHIKNFWKWILKIPSNQNPNNDATGAKCTTGQQNTNSSVFYLAPNNGGTSQRTCKVPAGKGLFIPVMPMEASDKELPKASVADLSKSAKDDQDHVNSLYLKIGDKEYNFQDLNKYRTRTDGFDAVFPDNGIFGVIKGGASKAVADGRYIITEPLAKGTYNIHFKSSLIDPSNPNTNFAQDITYNVIAE